MITLYSGTPGSGKSLHLARTIVQYLKYKKNVVSNIPINIPYIKKKFKKKIGNFTYLSNSDFAPDFFYDYAKENHVQGKENQTLIVIDECQMLFSPAVCKVRQGIDKLYRTRWLEFFTQHRHIGYTVILVAQFDKLIDAQIRYLIEYNYIHRKVNNFKIGWILSLLKISVFCCVVYWYGVHQKIESQFFTYSKKYSNIYNSYQGIQRFSLLNF